MKREPSKIEALLSLIALVVMVYPAALEPRVWWYLAMRGSQHGARRLSQAAILAGHAALRAETHYRQEVA